jgi:hypothetical protein
MLLVSVPLEIAIEFVAMFFPPMPRWMTSDASWLL